MADIMAYRGPDDQGLHCEGPVGLAHRRLSIIDLAHGHQPIANEDGSLWLVYNGEVYNHLDLRRELESRGHVYRTRSDSETILHAYEEYGERCVERFRGMFAFALWDRRRQRLFLARDRFGVKPLYYAERNGSVLFASEVKGILASGEVSARLREERIAEQLCLGYLAGDETLLEGIRKLPAGHTMTVDAQGCRLRQYWDFPADAQLPPDAARSPQALRTRFAELLEDAVKARLMSDVPLGAFLSGGIDSSAVVALMTRHCDQPVQTFSVGYADCADSELDYARLAAAHFGADHHEVVLGAREFRDALPRLIWHEDKPIAFPASVALYFVAELARQHVKVVLTGEGADELLGGYDRYAITWWHLRLGRLYEQALPRALRRAVRRLTGRLVNSGAAPRKLERTFLALPTDLESLYVGNFLGYFHGGELAAVLHPDLAANSPYRATLEFARNNGGRDLLASMQYLDIKTYLEELLMKQDRMSMAASIESRVPFLDHHLAEFVAALPWWFKLRRGVGKRILRQVMRGVVPDPIIARKKMGFPVPIAQWFRADLASWCREVLLDGAASARGYLNRARLETMIREHAAGRARHEQALWQILNFQLWCDLLARGALQAAPPRLAAAAGSAA